MSEEYRQLTDGQKMLRYFYDELEAAFERGESDLLLQISRIAGEAAVYIRTVTTGGLRDVAEELGLGSGMRRKDLAEMRRRLCEEEDLLLGGYEPLYPDKREPWIKCHDGSLLTREQALRQIEEERESRRLAG